MMKKTIPLVAAALAALLAAGAARAADLDVEVQGLAAGDGQVLLAVYADAADWLKKPVAVAGAEASAARDGRLVVHVAGVPEGSRLAVSLFHDRNGNGRLDMNAMGMPVEPFGFSNDAAGSFGPPKFEQAAFALPVGRIVVHLN